MNDTENPQGKEGEPSRASFHTGNTTQGGSNFGQGSGQLGKAANKQGSQEGDGPNYENEQGWDNEALRSEEIKKNNESSL